MGMAGCSLCAMGRSRGIGPDIRLGRSVEKALPGAGPVERGDSMQRNRPAQQELVMSRPSEAGRSALGREYVGVLRPFRRKSELLKPGFPVVTISSPSWRRSWIGRPFRPNQDQSRRPIPQDASPIEIRSQRSSRDNVLSPRFPRPGAVAGIAGAVAVNCALDACGTVMKGWGLR